jgi:molybdopterin synthase catalytic subunit
MIRTGIQDQAIDPGSVLSGLAAPEDGACVLFLGVVRNHNEGKTVVGLKYEAYREMADKTLEEIAGEAGDRFGTNRLVVVHRIGELEVGDVATAIAVATPHRAEAYEASRYVIEEIKRRLPIWKRERYLEGESGWIGGE